MAISVPIYDRRVIEAAGPSYRQQLSGAPIAAAAGAVAGGLRSVAELAEQKMNEFDAAGLQAARAKAVRARLDAERRFDEQQGVNALAWSEHAPQAFADELGKIAEGLNGRQAVEWGRIRDDELAGFQGSIDGRVVKEHEALKEESHTALTTGLVEKASLLARDGPDNPELPKVADDLRKLVAGRAWDQGWTKAKAEAAGLAAMSELHAGAVKTMLARGDAKNAKAYLDANRTEVAGAVAGGLLDDIRVAGLRVDAFEASEILARSNMKGEWDFDLAGALAEARANKQIGKREGLLDLVVDRLDDRARQVETSRKVNDEPKLTSIMIGILRTDKIDDDSDDWKGLSPHGRLTALEKLDSHIKSDRSSDADARRAQDERDALAIATYNAMPLDQRIKADPHGPEFKRTRPIVPLKLMKEQQDDIRQWNKDRGVSERDWRNSFAIEGAAWKMGKPALQDVDRYAVEALKNWRAAHPAEGDLPPPDILDEAKREAFKLVIRKTPWYQRDREVFAYQEYLRSLAEGRPTATAPATAPTPAVKRTERRDPTTGEVRIWNGTSWVKE